MLNCHLNCLANSFLKGRSVSLFFLFVWGLGWNNVQCVTLIFALKVALNAAVETRVYWRSRLIRSNQQHLGSPSAGDNQLQTGGRLFCCGLPSCVSVPSLFFKVLCISQYLLFWCFPPLVVPGCLVWSPWMQIFLLFWFKQVYTGSEAKLQSLWKLLQFCLFSWALWLFVPSWLIHSHLYLILFSQQNSLICTTLQSNWAAHLLLNVWGQKSLV